MGENRFTNRLKRLEGLLDEAKETVERAARTEAWGWAYATIFGPGEDPLTHQVRLACERAGLSFIEFDNSGTTEEMLVRAYADACTRFRMVVRRERAGLG